MLGFGTGSVAGWDAADVGEPGVDIALFTIDSKSVLKRGGSQVKVPVTSSHIAPFTRD